ncbi:hypothetical protein RQP46_004335 [Phenoliferia psychrophenolica]
MDYASLVKRYSDGIPCPPDFSFPTSVLDALAVSQRTHTAIHWVAHDFSSERKVSYEELSDLTHRAAIAFDQLGFRKGDRVMVQLGRRVEWWVVLFGLMRLGVIPVPGTSLLVGKDLKTRALAAKAVAFIGDESSCGVFASIAKDVGVPLNRIVQTRADGKSVERPLHQRDDWEPKDVFLNLGDLGWAKAAYMTFGTFLAGATLFCLPPTPGSFSPNQLIDAVHKYGVTNLCAPPTAYRSLCTTEAKERMRTSPPSKLVHCVSGGEPMNAAVIKTWKAITGIEICDGWGQTETGILVGNYRGVPIRPGSMGVASPGFEIGVIGVDRILGDGEEGELCVRTDVGGGSRYIFKGYLKEGGLIDKREKVVGGKTWYCTGDRGIRDKDGYFWFVGRDDDVITSAGYRIGPFEVESALKEHAAVLESAAVASPDPTRGEIVKAFVVLSAEYESRFGDVKAMAALTAELQTHCRAATAPFKYPREIEYIKELPKTVSGKLERVKLRNAEYEKKKDIVRDLKSKL